jgi:hypothetical protein
MTEDNTSLATVYQGGDTYQQLLLQAVAPLSDEPRAFHAAPHVRSIRESLRAQYRRARQVVSLCSTIP